MIFFCLAAVIFPIGFSQEAIGGAPYQLPNSYQVRKTVESTASTSNLNPTGRNLVHILRHGPVDDGDLGTVRK